MPVAGPADDRAAASVDDADADSEWDDVAPLLPADDSGYQLRPRDAEYLDVSPQQVRWWHRREAPLGMTPGQYREFKESLYAALEADGISPDEVDIRLQGSSARFFSGAHKRFPSDDDPAVRANEAAQRGLREWFGDDDDRPLRFPFDASYKLRLRKKKSDYDIQISSDAMMRKVREVRDDENLRGPLISAKYGFANKLAFGMAFPTVLEWAGGQSGRLGRSVVPALFPSSGPRNNSPTISAHFRSTDWMIERN